MLEELMDSYQVLGNMLSDVQEQFADLHPDDLASLLRNCELKAMELAQEILARREYVQELSPYWKVTASGLDAGMPPGAPLPGIGDDAGVS